MRRPGSAKVFGSMLSRKSSRERVMGVSTNYLGHVEIVPSLNQAEYDYLDAFARSRRSDRPGGPYAVTPEDPHTGSSEREIERYNRIADGQPGYWCQWVPCPRGCCLVWNGHEKFCAGPAWLQYLIDHFLRRDARAKTSGGSQFAGFTFNHEMRGMIVGEQADNRELFLLSVEANEVNSEILRRGDCVLPWESGYQGLDDRPWLAGERPWRFSSDYPPPELAVAPSPELTRRRRKSSEG
jgi:hypothetical protein